MRRIGIAVRVLHGNRTCGAGAALLDVQAQGGDDGLVAELRFDEGSGDGDGGIEVSSGQYFTTLEGAVMECLTKRGEGADRCSLSGIADEGRMPIAVVLGVIGGLLG
jgi:hypothetical protein